MSDTAVVDAPAHHWRGTFDYRDLAAKTQDADAFIQPLMERAPTPDKAADTRSGYWVSGLDAAVQLSWWESTQAGASDVLALTCDGIAGNRLMDMVKAAFLSVIEDTEAAGASRVSFLRECRETWLVLEKLVTASPRDFAIVIRRPDVAANDGQPRVDFSVIEDHDPAEAWMYLPEPPSAIQVAHGMAPSGHDRICDVLTAYLRKTEEDLSCAWASLRNRNTRANK